MQALLTRIAATEGPDSALLIALVNLLRPAHAHDIRQASSNLLALCHLLEKNPSLRQGLRRQLQLNLGTRRQSHLYTDTGIFDGTGFFSEMRQRLTWKILPPARNDAYFRDLFSAIFHRPDDHVWTNGIDDTLWQQLVTLLQAGNDDDTGADNTALPHQPRQEILAALTTLAHRLTALGLDPQLVHVHPDIEAYESPFLAVNTEISDYVRRHHETDTARDIGRHDEKQALVLLTQCRELLQKVRLRMPETGVSIQLTQIMVRLFQIMDRMEKLLLLLEKTGGEQQLAGICLFKELVAADNRKYSLREVFATHTDLLALQVTENAGRTGEHYVTATRHDYFGMLRSGLGAGFIVGFMALLKILAGKISMAPIAAAFVYSMNYSLGFMLVHVLHFTIATKQPAMTAARIAASIQATGERHERNLEALADLCVNVFRTQFIAITGNVLLALPMAWLLAWLWFFQTGHHLAAPEKVQSLLHDIDPLHSLAVFHAAIAGVCLFCAGLISGYYDNRAVFTRIPERLRQRPSLQWLLGEKHLATLTGYLENNLGALAGNFYFGIMLGSMGTVGFILGLPLDIRHITFSSAYFGFALAGSDNHMTLSLLCTSLAGIAAIGLTNLLVSFSLALMVALRSRGVRYRQWLPLAGMILRRFRKHPLHFFWPPRDVPPATADAG